uniref:Uncharacterized protein n=1 Tax=Moniliophthora roreri TaxID=221103 RepID=A0A0W0FXM4_MONRR
MTGVYVPTRIVGSESNSSVAPGSNVTFRRNADYAEITDLAGFGIRRAID